MPGNGIDEDGVGGDLPASATAYRDAPDARRRVDAAPDVVLVVLESFRANLVGARSTGSR